jgi:GGDEF domain-containing protein
VAKSWFSWLTGKDDKGETRRADVPRAAIEITPQDLDPTTGALRWDRFVAMLDAERAQGPGVLLIIDLSARSGSVSAITGHRDEEILPWLAQSIQQAIRSDDLLAHVDDYRFAALLRGAPPEVASAISARILESVDDTIFMTSDGIVHLGVTVGGAVYAPAGEGNIVDAAIDNLNVAKGSGRGVVVQ